MAHALGRTHADFARHYNLDKRACGHVWQARYFSAPLDRTHLWRAMAYVERNPVRAHLVEHAEQYAWSSTRLRRPGAENVCRIDLSGWRSEYDWQRWKKALETSIDEEAFGRRSHEASRRGLPLGDEQFTTELEERCGRRNTRPACRPAEKIGWRRKGPSCVGIWCLSVLSRIPAPEFPPRIPESPEFPEFPPAGFQVGQRNSPHRSLDILRPPDVFTTRIEGEMTKVANEKDLAGCEELSRRLFERIQEEFQTLKASIDMRPAGRVRLSLTFNPQGGLPFRVVAMLRGDELGLGIGDAFWNEWFPCTDPEVTEKFAQALRGVLSGKLQLVDRGKMVFKADLQQPSGTGWETIARWSRPRFPSFVRARVSTLRNSPASN